MRSCGRPAVALAAARGCSHGGPGDRRSPRRQRPPQPDGGVGPLLLRVCGRFCGHRRAGAVVRGHGVAPVGHAHARPPARPPATSSGAVAVAVATHGRRRGGH